MDNYKGEVYLALDNLRTSIENKIDSVDRRQRDDLSELRGEVNEIKKTVDSNHIQLVRVETQLAAHDNHKSFKTLKQQVWAGFLLVFATFGCMGVSWYQLSSERHRDTVTRVEENYKHIDEAVQQAVERAKLQESNKK